MPTILATVILNDRKTLYLRKVSWLETFAILQTFYRWRNFIPSKSYFPDHVPKLIPGIIKREANNLLARIFTRTMVESQEAEWETYFDESIIFEAILDIRGDEKGAIHLNLLKRDFIY